jgi:hypothetical protein
MNRHRASAFTIPDKTQAQIYTSSSDGGKVPECALANFSPIENCDNAGGAS